jgi:hypothetical protein
MKYSNPLNLMDYYVFSTIFKKLVMMEKFQAIAHFKQTNRYFYYIGERVSYPSVNCLSEGVLMSCC